MVPARSNRTPTAAPSSQTPTGRRRFPDPLEQERWNVEILRGVRLMSPRPAPPHAALSFGLAAALGPRFGRPSGGGPDGEAWWLLFEPELPMAGGDLLIPDLAGWRRERMPALPRSGALRVAPDWVCEVLSPSTERNDRQVKLPIYYAAGVEHVWLLDPIEQRLERFTRGAQAFEPAAIDSGNVVVRAAPFEALELDLGTLWFATE